MLRQNIEIQQRTSEQRKVRKQVRQKNVDVMRWRKKLKSRERKEKKTAKRMENYVKGEGNTLMNPRMKKKQRKWSGWL